MNIHAERVPSGWPNSLWIQQLGQWVDSRSSVASGWGTITAQYRFTPPAGSAGRRVELRFKAWTAGIIGELELRVILDVVPKEEVGGEATADFHPSIGEERSPKA